MDQLGEQKPYPFKELVVSNTSFDGILNGCHLSKESIKSLPTKAVVVEVGGGLNFNFARGVKSIRPDINVVSIDPSLGLNSDREDVVLSETGSFTTYHIGSKSRPTSQNYTTFQKRRFSQAKKIGRVLAARAEELPFAQGSVDLFVDYLGGGLYSDSDKLQTYISSLALMLKETGKAHVYPVRGMDVALPTLAEKQKILDKFLTQIADMSDVVIEPFIQDNSLGFTVQKVRKGSNKI